MKHSNNIQEELGEIAPQLSKIDKQSSFRVPENYFSELPDKVFLKIPKERVDLTFIDRLDRYVKETVNLIFQPRYAVPVASLTLLLIVGFNLFNGSLFVNNDPLAQISDISNGDIQDYIIENYEAEDIIAMDLQLEQGNGVDLNYSLTEEITEEELNNYIFQNIEEQFFEEELL